MKLLRSRNGRVKVPDVLSHAMWKSRSQAWQSESIPYQQLSLVEQQLSQWERGEPVPEFDSLASLMNRIDPPSGYLLEIGSSSGYYARVIRHLQPSVRYLGVDSSLAFCQLGHARFAPGGLLCGDALKLPFRNQEFEAVVSGSVLLHIEDWTGALAETLRVSSKSAIIHRTPVTDGRSRTMLKNAYGHRIVEWAFNEHELLSECARNGFQVDYVVDIGAGTALSSNVFAPSTRSYLLRRR